LITKSSIDNVNVNNAAEITPGAIAANDLGATPWQTFRYVTFPAIAPGVISAALLTFTLSIDDFVISFFVSGPGSTTLPLYIYSMVKRGVSPEINALSTILIVAIVGLMVLS
ncbi:ABC transporter permease, partial [Bacillus sp. D-CC]